MRNLIITLLIIISASMQAQDIEVFGFENTGNTGYLKLVGIDAMTGERIGSQIIEEFNGYALGSSCFNQYVGDYMFIGVDQDQTFRLASWNIFGDSIHYMPANQTGIYDMQFDMNSTNLYGLGNYAVDSVLIGPGMYEYTYAMRLLEINPQTAETTELSKLPNLQGVVAGATTFDANSGRYFINGIDSNYINRLFVVDATSGQLISQLAFNGLSGGNLSEIEYNNTDDKLYGLYRIQDPEENFIVSIDLETNEITPEIEIPDMQYSTQGASVLHQASQSLILYYIDTADVQRLLVAGLVSGQIEANPQVNGFTTGLEVNNVNYALNTYHNLTSVNNNTEEDEFNLYPNPAGEYLKVSGNMTLQEIVIFDLSGKMIYSVKLNTAPGHQINTENLNPGMYLLEAKTDEGRVYRTKFVRK